MSPELRAICQGFTLLTANYGSLKDYMSQKEIEGVERCIQKRKKELEDLQAAFDREIEEKRKILKVVLDLMGVSSYEEALWKYGNKSKL